MPKAFRKLIPLIIFVNIYGCTVLGLESNEASPEALAGEYEGLLTWHLPGDTASAQLPVRLYLYDTMFEALIYRDTFVRAGGMGTWRLTDSIMYFNDPRPYADSADLCKVLNRGFIYSFNQRRLLLLDSDCNGWHYDFDLIKIREL